MLKTFFMLICLFPVFLQAQGDVFVLCYHTFLSKQKLDTDFSPEDFAVQINRIRSLGYRFVTMQDVLSGNVYGRNNILLTIDDGNHSLKNIYSQVVMKNGIKPVLFISPAIIGKVKYALTRNELSVLQDSGATLGAHGYNHLFVNEKLLKKDKVSFNREIYYAKKRLNEMSGRDVRIYAYPFGVFSDATKQHLMLAGFDMAFSLRRGYLKVPLRLNGDMYDLPRWMVTKRSWPEIINKLKREASRFSSEMAQTKYMYPLQAEKNDKKKIQK